MNKAQYQEYLKSEHWQDIKRRYRKSKLNKGKCYVCGTKHGLQLHHKTYKRLGHERLQDFIWLCGVLQNGLNNERRKLHEKQNSRPREGKNGVDSMHKLWGMV